MDTYRHVEGTIRASDSPAPSKAAGELVYMSWVPEDRIPETHRRYVRRHVDRAAKAAGLGPITIRWFGPPVSGIHEGPDGRLHQGDFAAAAPYADAIPSAVAPDDQPMTIALNAGIRGASVPAILAHEVQHLVQRRDGLPPDETDATRAGFEYLDREAR
jgi:hypothetical protein